MSLPLLLRPARKGWRYDLTGSILPPILVFSRSTTGTYTGADGLLATAAVNEARFDYVSGVCRGLLVEPQSTNLCAQSRALGTSPWAGAGATLTQNSVAGVDGTMAADVWQYQDNNYRWRDDTAASFITATTTYPLNAYWTRVSSTITTPAGCVALRYYAARSDVPSRFLYYAASCSPGQLYTGTHYAQISGTGMALDAVQLETGSVATSWIPTAGTPSTRDADVVTMLDVSRPYRITYEPLAGGSIQSVVVASWQQPSAIYGRWRSIQQL